MDQETKYATKTENTRIPISGSEQRSYVTELEFPGDQVKYNSIIQDNPIKTFDIISTIGLPLYGIHISPPTTKEIQPQISQLVQEGFPDEKIGEVLGNLDESEGYFIRTAKGEFKKSHLLEGDLHSYAEDRTIFQSTPEVYQRLVENIPIARFNADLPCFFDGDSKLVEKVFLNGPTEENIEFQIDPPNLTSTSQS